MARASRVLAAAAAGIVMYATAMTAGHAAGALAVGSCAAYGYAFDFASVTAADSEAVRKCAGPGCKVVVNLRHSCGAFAIDAAKPCGPHGFASARQLASAQNQAMKSCYKFGGRDCVIRAFACDVKG